MIAPPSLVTWVKPLGLAAGLALVLNAWGADQLFRWVDDQGQAHFSNQPPVKSTGPVEVQALTPTAPTPTPGDDPYSVVNQVKQMEGERLERERVRVDAEQRRLEARRRILQEIEVAGQNAQPSASTQAPMSRATRPEQRPERPSQAPPPPGAQPDQEGNRSRSSASNRSNKTSDQARPAQKSLRSLTFPGLSLHPE
jgi:hypothetical protein